MGDGKGMTKLIPKMQVQWLHVYKAPRPKLTYKVKPAKTKSQIKVSENNNRNNTNNDNNDDHDYDDL